ncbi:tetrahydromethanopterin S-methyltransferase subunit F [Amycolatopsis endophytica]|uniref:Tetrahydromethanopterin S-methyltransferase subunit F n=1 Tax=Amycolatopsis endophytica TaxID=860233 RepID=A0A853B027_9PSEU|nr:hypothetical protein [Amycolatopsis endophytica]NYI88413.1 tetrahydromethanopterin S-methyltransferase subunit F [Amycolatopsis endophytica]
MIRYQLALLAHSQRYLPPLLAYVILLSVLYSDAGSEARPLFGVSAGALTVVACWLTIALVDAEDPVQRLITQVHAGRLSTVLSGIVAAVVVCCAALMVVPLVWAALVHSGFSTDVLVDGLIAHVACVAAGVAIGLPCSRLLLPRIGYTVLAALALLGVVLLAKWVPVVNPMLRALLNHGARSTVVLGLAGGVVLLAVSAAGTGWAIRRRG